MNLERAGDVAAAGQIQDVRWRFRRISSETLYLECCSELMICSPKIVICTPKICLNRPGGGRGGSCSGAEGAQQVQGLGVAADACREGKHLRRAPQEGHVSQRDALRQGSLRQLLGPFRHRIPAFHLPCTVDESPYSLMDLEIWQFF